MQALPQAIWMQVAQGQALGPPWLTLFKLPDTELAAALELLVIQPARASGADAATVQAYTTVAPLLLEHQAIRAFVARQPQYQRQLPIIPSLGDALMYASLEYQLSPAQQAKLKKLLHQALKN